MMTSVSRLFAAGLVAMLCHLPGAQAADRSAEYSAVLAKAVWGSAGFDVQRLTVDEPGGLALSAFRFDPASSEKLISARIVPAPDPKGIAATALLVQRGRGPGQVLSLVINGGYFYRAADGTLTPTGLLISNGRELAPLTSCRACSGVLYAVAGKPGLEIAWAKGFKVTVDVTSAIQTGPLLVEPGGKLGIAKPGGPLAERSAICLSAKGRTTVVAVTSRVTLYELATLLKSPAPGGFGCDVAINLDGGPSTQIATSLSKPKMIGTASPVENFVVFDWIVPWWF